MAPKQHIVSSEVVSHAEPDRPRKNPYDTKPGEKPYKLEIVWRNVLIFIYLHAAAAYAITLHIEKLPTYFITVIIFGWFGSYGISAGAHRLWCHRSYKANRPLQYFLLFLQSVALQNSVIEWVRDHRVHHKYSDTNADPHNATRGFFFSHMGWLLCKKHPDVFKYGKKIDMTDLTSDPLLRFQTKYYVPIVILCSFVLPTWICTLFGESVWTAFHLQIMRYVLTLHITWSINSVSHLWGSKPFEKDIQPTDTYLIGMIAFGEGWHNFHHVYPWDYKVSELPRYWCNFTIPFIDFFAWLGWATDLKTVSDEIIRKRIARTGDGTHRYSQEELKHKSSKELQDLNNNMETKASDVNDSQYERIDNVWGWDDADLDPEERQDVKILNPKYEKTL